MNSLSGSDLAKLLYGALTSDKKTPLETLSDLEAVNTSAAKSSGDINDEIINPLKNELLALAAQYAQTGGTSPSKFLYPYSKG